MGMKSVEKKTSLIMELVEVVLFTKVIIHLYKIVRSIQN